MAVIVKKAVRKKTVKRAKRKKSSTTKPTKKKVVKRKVVATKTSTSRYANLRIHQVKCVKTTKEIDKDEIVLCGIETSGEVVMKRNKKSLKGKAREGKRISVGKFKKRTVKNYKNPKVVARLNLGSRKADWPRNYIASILMIEKDEGQIGKIVNSVVKAIDKQVTKAVVKIASGAATAAAGSALSAIGAGAAAGSVVPLVGTAVGAAAAAAVAAGFSVIKKARADDVFPPKRLKLKLNKHPSRKGQVSGSKKKVTFRGFGGVYTVLYSWSIS